jgi:hypothetical protein
VKVEVDEGDRLVDIEQPRDRPHPDRAVAAEDEGELPRRDRSGDPVRGVANDLDDLGQVLSSRIPAVGAPAPGLAVAVIPGLDTGVRQGLDQASVSEGSRSPLLTGREGAGAGRDPDHTHGTTHRLTLARGIPRPGRANAVVRHSRDGGELVAALASDQEVVPSWPRRVLLPRRMSEARGVPVGLNGPAMGTSFGWEPPGPHGSEQAYCLRSGSTSHIPLSRALGLEPRLLPSVADLGYVPRGVQL